MGHDPAFRAPRSEGLPWIAALTNARDTRRKYKKAYFWTIDDEVSMRNCLDYGVDGLITNYPEVLQRVLTEAPYRELLRLATPNDTLQLRVHGIE